jgi:hypothetical protein
MTTETSSRIGLGDVTPPEPPHPPRARLLALRFETDLPLIGLVLMIALLPLRSNWGVDLILFGLGFTVPGVLALRALRIPAASVRAFPIYVPAAALLVMTAAGLGCDLIGPHLGVAKPLHGDATALATVALSDILWLIGLRAPTAARLPWAQVLHQPRLLAPLLLPALAAYGSMLLSHGHGAGLARVSMAIDLAAFFGCLLAAHRLSRRQIVAILFCCALAIEWSWSLRGEGIIGYDISTEFYIANHTHQVGIWHTLHRNDAYGAMLSVGILPSVLDALMGVSPLITLKVLYPLFAAAIPVAIFLIGGRILSRRFAVVAAGLLLIQDYFFQQLPELARQEVALVFFAALFAALLERQMRRSAQTGLVLLLALGTVVSHYSTTYLAIPLMVVAVLSRLLIGRYRGIQAVCLPWLVAAVTLIGGSLLWYGVITHSANNVSAFTSTIDHQGLNLLPHSGNLLDTYLNGNNVQNVSAARLQRLAVVDYRKYAAFVKPLPAGRDPQYAIRAATVPGTHRSALASDLVLVLDSVFNEGLLLCLSLGALVMMLRRRCSAVVAEIGFLAFGGLAFLLFIRVSGTAAAQYNQSRALLQSLVILALPAAWLVERLLGRLRPRLRALAWPVIVVVMMAMFVQQTGMLDLLIGGGTSLNLSAGGEDYERYYETPAELAAARYAEKRAVDAPLYADRYGALRIEAATGRVALTNVIPRTLDRFAWVYGTRTNVQLGRARTQVDNSFLTYHWPAAYLNRFYDLVYTNGDSEVYHGG